MLQLSLLWDTFLESNLIEIQRIEIQRIEIHRIEIHRIEIQRIEFARYSNQAYFPEEFFFDKLNIFVKHSSLKFSLSLFLFFQHTLDTIQLTRLICTIVLLSLVFNVPPHLIMNGQHK